MTEYKYGDRIELITGSPSFRTSQTNFSLSSAVGKVKKGSLGIYNGLTTDGNAKVTWDDFSQDECLVGLEFIAKHEAVAQWPVAENVKPKRWLDARDTDYRTLSHPYLDGYYIVVEDNTIQVRNSKVSSYENIVMVFNLDHFDSVVVREETEEQK